MEAYIPRFFKPPEQSFFLFGPRGTGKSTLLKKIYDNALWIDLLKPDLFRRYSAKPERISELINGNPDKNIIIIDEVQKIPELLNVIHSLIEEKKEKRFILTGSSARKLKRTGIDLLAGRAIKCSLFPFIAAELGKDFNFENALLYGLVPVISASKKPEEVLKTYISLYIQEEIRMEGLIRNIGNFNRFLEAVSFSHGSVLNISNISRECEVERKVVENYLNILEDLLISYRLPVFSKKAKRKLAAHSKFYFFDTGVFRALRPKGPYDKPEEISGIALEGLIAQHLTAWNSYIKDKFEIYYWRTQKGMEIDFILYGPGGLYAIEVKNTDKIRTSDFKSLYSFQNEYPECKTLFLYRGNEKLLIKNILCMPCEEFLTKLNPDFNLTSLF